MRTNWAIKVASVLAGTAIFPLVGEIITSTAMDEPFNVQRVTTFFLVLGGAALLFLAIGKSDVRARSLTWQLIVAWLVIVGGLTLFVFGFFLAVEPRPLATHPVNVMVGMITACVGLLVTGGGIAFNLEHQQRRRELSALPRALEPALAIRRRPTKVEAHKFDNHPDETDEVMNLCRDTLSIDDLHYFAYYTKDRAAFRIDCLDDPLIPKTMMGHNDAVERRRGYHAYGPELRKMMNDLDETFEEMESGKLIRLVLDVERGAIYYFVIDSNRYIIGVTLDQRAIHVADRRLQMLVDAIITMRGGLPYSEQPT
jgi:hypothetical protein